MLKVIADELKHHTPFTVLGALFGIIFMIIFRNIPRDLSLRFFHILHPIHVFLSALVTASMYKRHKCTGVGKCNIWFLLLVGYVGSIGIATLSDSLIPYLGEFLFNMPNREMHIGFIEKWWIVSPVAIIGIAIAYFNTNTKAPHAGHVLLSTWASLFHILMALGPNMPWHLYIGIFTFLFLSVWLPCCISDIVFPLMFVKEGEANHAHQHH